MAKPNNSKNGGNDSSLNFEPQLRAAAEPPVPAASSRINYTAMKLARMNLAIRGIDANLGLRNADSFRTDLHPDLKADFILVTAT